MLSQSKIVKDKDGIKVIKKYDTFKSLKWVFSLTNILYPFVYSPAERFRREFNFLSAENEINKPRIYYASEKDKVIVREYIEGEVGCYDGKSLGKIMSQVHGEGYVIGDTKLENFVCTNKGAYIIDAEQSIISNNYREFDIYILLLSAKYKSFIKKENFSRFLLDFSSSYEMWKRYDKSMKLNCGSLKFKMNLFPYFLVLSEYL
ncbi:MAG: hypothetical protein OH318_02950 [Candidatus Parvarchaeota archaeon]|nr:hypothetical protein [Candidatus Rehaiarchaeum fermentans]